MSEYSSIAKKEIGEIKRVAPPTAESLYEVSEELAILAEKYETDYKKLFSAMVRASRKTARAAAALEKINNHANTADLYVGPVNMERPPLESER